MKGRRAAVRAPREALPAPAPERPTAAEAEPVPAPHRVRAERSLGVSMSDVRVHRRSLGRDVAAAHGARGVTIGRDIFLGQRAQANPAEGEAVMAHELVHAAQPQGRSAAGTAGSGDPAESQARQLAPAVAAGHGAARPMARRTAAVHRDDPPGAPATAPTVAGAVLWGIDTATRAIYASVSAPGRPIADIAAYMYGSPDAAVALRANNGALTDFVPAGTTIRLTGDALAAGAHADLQRALDGGTILRTSGIPDSESDVLVTYRFSAGGTDYDLTPAQLQGMLRGLGTYILRKANYFKDMVEVVRDVQADHIANTNSVIRNILEFEADVEAPPESSYSGPISMAEGIAAAVGDGAALTPQIIAANAAELRTLAQDYARADLAWRTYINGTIEAGEVTVRVLEFTRDASFVIAASIAAIIAAPLVIPATGLTLATGAAAIGVGALAGGTTYAGLEFTGTLGGQGFANLITPGPSRGIDWGEVGDRTKTGAWRGTVAGAVSAGAVIAAPGVTAGIAARGFGLTAEGLAGAGMGTRVAVGFLAGVTIGAPAGMVQTAITDLPALANGRLSSQDYLSHIGWGTLSGAAFGGAFGAIGGIRAPTSAPGTAIEPVATPLRPGTGAAVPDFVLDPPIVNTTTGRVTQTATQMATGERMTLEFDPTTGRTTLTRLATGEVRVIDPGIGGPALGSGTANPNSPSALTVVGNGSPVASPMAPGGGGTPLLGPGTTPGTPPLLGPGPVVPGTVAPPPRVGPIITPAPPVRPELGPGNPTTHTLAQIRNMKQPFKWQAGEVYTQKNSLYIFCKNFDCMFIRFFF